MINRKSNILSVRFEEFDI